MIAFRYVQAPDEYVPTPDDPPSVFLGGGIPNTRNWQHEARLMLYAAGLPMIVVNPRRAEFPVDDPVAGELQVAWEHKHLHRVTVSLFWFAAPDPDADVPAETVVQPSTLFELGVALGEGRRIAVGVDPLYPRADIVYRQLAMYPHVVVHDSLRDTVRDVVRRIDPASEPSDEPASPDVRTKLTGLTRQQTAALAELLTDHEKQRVTIGKTVVEFAMSAEDAGVLVGAAQGRATNRYAHPYASLHGVLRKLAAVIEGGEPRG